MKFEREMKYFELYSDRSLYSFMHHTHCSIAHLDCFPSVLSHEFQVKILKPLAFHQFGALR